MPRLAFALPFLPHKEAHWRATAEQVHVRQATEHRMFLRDRGIFKERWWMQTGIGTPSLTLVLWDADAVKGIRPASADSEDAHERWLATEIVRGIHGIDPADYRMPKSELLSGTTTMATATAETQTLFALPIPEEGLPALRSLLERIEHGDLAKVHEAFLIDASIREEWMWLQGPLPDCPPLLLIHWIGDDLDDAWQRLTYIREDEYARVLHQALFTRLVGISPQKVAKWEIEQLLVMHVRRSDSFDGTRRNLGQRAANAIAGGASDPLARLMSPQVVGQFGDASLRGPSAVTTELMALRATQGITEVTDVLVGDSHVLAMVRGPDGGALTVLLDTDGTAVTSVRLLETGDDMGG